MEKVDLLLRLLREGNDTIWIADQLSETYSEGVLIGMKDINEAEFFQLEPSDITRTERVKRQKYETTRTFSDQEKLELLENGLKKVFVEIPAIQSSTFAKLRKFDPSVTEINFVPQDEEREIESHSISLSDVTEKQEDLKDRFNNFLESLRQ